jgi:hypothetical protein
MSIHKGTHHWVNGKMRKIRKPRRKAILEAVHVEEPNLLANTLPLDDYGKRALEAVLDSVWSNMTIQDKIEALDPRDPSNPEGL